MREMARLLLIGGAVLLIAGLVMTFLSRVGVNRIPGDFVVRRGNFTFFFPLMTSLLLSIGLTLLFWLFRR